MQIINSVMWVLKKLKLQADITDFRGQSQALMTLTHRLFENIVGKGENDGNQRFLLFLTMFSVDQRGKSSF